MYYLFTAVINIQKRRILVACKNIGEVIVANFSTLLNEAMSIHLDQDVAIVSMCSRLDENQAKKIFPLHDDYDPDGYTDKEVLLQGTYMDIWVHSDDFVIEFIDKPPLGDYIKAAFVVCVNYINGDLKVFVRNMSYRLIWKSSTSL